MKNINPVDLNFFRDLFVDFHVDVSGYKMPILNTEAVGEFLERFQNEDTGDFLSVEYQRDDEIVNLGVIAEQRISADQNFNYAKVPFGFILKGEVVVVKEGKATKKLSGGDFIGLFETVDWLHFHRTMQIGDWSLVAGTDVQIIFFGASVFEKDKIRIDPFIQYLTELARLDKVPQPITTLPLLDWVASHTTEFRPSDTIIIAHTHILPNNLPFFRHLAYLVGPSRIFVMDKPYSTVKAIFNELVSSGIEVIPLQIQPGLPYEFATQKSTEVLWKKIFEEKKKSGFKKILIVDDGGDITMSIPWQNLDGVLITSVEQTQRGITRIISSGFKIPPIVSVASSGIKKIVEAKFIGESVVRELESRGQIAKAQSIGIVGRGSIGKEVERALKRFNKEILFYDPSPLVHLQDDEHMKGSLDSLINESDLIIGTTGGDALKGIALERIIGNKFFASASSSDVEFASLLRLAETVVDPFETITIKVHENFTAYILNGGFPINFNRKSDATPSEDIVLTRCLMYIGTMQALHLFGSRSGIYNLDKISQEHLLERWTEDKRAAQQNILIEKRDIPEIIGYSDLENGLDMPSIWRS